MAKPPEDQPQPTPEPQPAPKPHPTSTASASPSPSPPPGPSGAGKKTQIVVVGGGAGGLPLVRRLGAKFGRRCDVILLEKNDTHVWKPLLHEIAAGALDANLDEVGYRGHGARWRYRFFRGELESIDRRAGEVVVAPLVDSEGVELTGRHRIRYDYLVLATGAISNDFGVPGARDHCMVLDNRGDADRFRQRLLDRCLRVSRLMMAQEGADATVSVAIVGGGATGVELAAELHNAAEGLSQYGLEVFEQNRMAVTLIEAGPRILPALPEKLAQAAQEELTDLNVRVLTGASVAKVSAEGMELVSGEVIPADLKVWAAGVRGHDMLRDLDGLEVNRVNQLVVTDTLQTTRDEKIFALGDCCSFTPAGEDRPVPPRAQAANQMANTVYQNLCGLIEGKPLKKFTYRDRGSLVSLSTFSTVGSLMGNLIGGRMAVEGRLARLVYVSLYRMHLLSIHGWIMGLAFMMIGRVNRVIRPKLKLH